MSVAGRSSTCPRDGRPGTERPAIAGCGARCRVSLSEPRAGTRLHTRTPRAGSIMKAEWKGEVVAESDETVVVEGNHYFPRDSVRDGLLRESPTTTVCGSTGEMDSSCAQLVKGVGAKLAPPSIETNSPSIEP